MKSKKSKYRTKKVSLFLLILFISIGFAYLTTNLNIFGSTLLKGQKFDVHFENVQVSTEGVQIETPTIIDNRTTVEYNVTLDKPGDFVEFTVDAKNDGSLDAMIKEFDEIKIYEGDSETPLTEVPEYLDYSVTYDDGSEIVEKQLLKIDEKVTYKIHIEYKKDITKEQLVKQRKRLRATFNVNYEPADDTVQEIEKPYAYLEEQDVVSDRLWDIWDFNTANLFKAKKMLRADMITEEEKNSSAIVSKDDSKYEIYMFYNTEEETLYYYTDAEKIYLSDVQIDFYDEGNGQYLARTLFNGFQDIEYMDLSGFDTSKMTTMVSLFSGLYNLKEINLSGWETSNVTNMYAMFQFCGSLEELDLSSWDTSNVTVMGATFEQCESLTKLDLTNWDTRKVTTMSSMFANCFNLTELHIEDFETPEVTTMSAMFMQCASMEEFDLSHFYTPKLVDMWGIFDGCKALRRVNISNFDTSHVTIMENLFDYCESLEELDISNFDTGLVTRMDNMFRYCGELTRIYVGPKFTTKSAPVIYSMYAGCNKLIKGYGYECDYDTGVCVKNDAIQVYVTLKEEYLSS